MNIFVIILEIFVKKLLKTNALSCDIIYIGVLLNESFLCLCRQCTLEAVMFSLSVVHPDVLYTHPQGGQVHFTHTAAESSCDRPCT